MKRVRIEKYRPAPRHSAISALLQMMSFNQPRNASKDFSPSIVRTEGRTITGKPGSECIFLPDDPRKCASTGENALRPRFSSRLSAHRRRLRLQLLDLPGQRL